MSDLRDAARRIAADSAHSQGFGVRISDPAVLGKISALIDSDAPDRLDPIRIEAVEAPATGGDHDMLNDGGEDCPLAA